MRRLSLFVQTPLLSSLDFDSAEAIQDGFFSIYPLNLDPDYFSLLLEAKPCVLLVSVDQVESHAEVGQFLDAFRKYRVERGGLERDPGLRIVIVSDSRVPRVSWSHLGVYELMVGPVFPNVLSYKLVRHYHKAISAKQGALPLVLKEENEALPTVKNEKEVWRVFAGRTKSASAPETLLRSFPRPEEVPVQKTTILMRIPDLDPEEGVWALKTVDEESGEELWEWKNKDGIREGVPDLAFAGERPVYVPEKKCWQFTSEMPKLYRGYRKARERSTLLECILTPDDFLELKVAPSLKVEAFKRQLFVMSSSGEEKVELNKRIRTTAAGARPVAGRSERGDSKEGGAERRASGEVSLPPSLGQLKYHDPSVMPFRKNSSSFGNDEDGSLSQSDESSPVSDGKNQNSRTIDGPSAAVIPFVNSKKSEARSPREEVSGKNASEILQELKQKVISKKIEELKGAPKPGESKASAAPGVIQKNGVRGLQKSLFDEASSATGEASDQIRNGLSWRAPDRYSPDGLLPAISNEAPKQNEGSQALDEGAKGIRSSSLNQGQDSVASSGFEGAGSGLEKNVSSGSAEPGRHHFKAEDSRGKNGASVRMDEAGEGSVFSVLYEDDELRSIQKDGNAEQALIESIGPELSGATPGELHFIRRIGKVSLKKKLRLMNKNPLAPVPKLTEAQKKSLMGRILAFIVGLFQKTSRAS